MEPPIPRRKSDRTREIRPARGIPQPARARPNQGALRLRPRRDRRGSDARDRRQRSRSRSPQVRRQARSKLRRGLRSRISAPATRSVPTARASVRWDMERWSRGSWPPHGSGLRRQARQARPAIHGVAFDARVLSVGVGARDLEEVIDEIVADYPHDPTPEQIAELQARVLDVEAQLERELERDTGIAFVRLNGRVTAVNCSFGVPGNIEDFGAQELRERFSNVIEAMAQADTAAGERTVYVWAAGNAHGEIGTGRVAGIGELGRDPARASGADPGAAGSFVGRRGDQPARHDRRLLQPLRDRQGVLSGRARRGHHEYRAGVPLRGWRIAVFHYGRRGRHLLRGAVRDGRDRPPRPALSRPARQ